MREILIVDDNLSSLKQIGSSLEGKYNYSMAKSGQQALVICAQRRPDLILLDVAMPGMDGFETMAKLKESPALSGIPVIFVSGFRDTETEAEGLRLGARDFIKKPVVKKVLLHRLALHLNISSYQSQLVDSVRILADSLSTSISELIECRDENTGGHVLRTSGYFTLLGQDLIARGAFSDQLTPKDLDMMARAAPLHDVGKIAISDKILLKPDCLTDEEFRIMKTHTVAGAEILRQMYERNPTLRYLKYAILIAASHHERYDGKGYPTGESGDDIPLCGRIMAVADVYDAIVNDRVYHKGLTHVEAYRVIMDGRGSQFEPMVVDSFATCHEKFVDMSAVPRRLGEAVFYSSG
jgi:putative two-component system response regulator